MADIVFINGQVVTADSSNRIAEAVAVTGNRIVAVGQNEKIKNLITDATAVIDLRGKSLLPGFIDSHLHITLHGTNKLAINCKEPQMKSLDDIFDKLKRKAQQTPKGEWIRAWGFNETAIAEQRYPTRIELDEISSDHPIMIMRTCAHHSIVNSQALKIAGINDKTPDPPGGKFDRDCYGNLNGFLIETAHMQMLNAAKYSEMELRKGIALASDHYVEAGITSIHDAGGNDADSLRAMQLAVQAGEVKVRIYAMLSSLNHSAKYVRRITESGMVTGLGNEYFKIGPAKVFTDGASSVPTMATREPYTSNPNESGVLYYDQNELNEVLGEAHKKGLQITAHAQGDRAIDMLLTCMETALKEFPRDNHRHRIEHAGLSMPDLIKRMKKLNVIPIPNPNFFYEFGDAYIKHIGERVNQMYPLRDLLDSGLVVACGSDNPVSDHNPLLGIHCAVNRRSMSGQEAGLSQRVDVLEAIKMYTWNGAYASFEEEFKGSIEPGKLADLVILDQEILTIPTEHIKELNVESTIIDGKFVYQSETSNLSYN
ncbi:amidohydrolase [Bacillus sp. V2I10]|uniref:amidohydrolase n=1 Tax=Bacillus sp. V2I10 TaxID=3042276 RepID=UPI00277E1878|nr:amidohydrolase [Bacillus sp. V2I10]MDQ0857879.1 putative amidohydrolase YtcJ [Bacillus sp. V2I10]